MNFKEEYKQAFSEIKLEEAFKKSLAEEMSGSSKRKRMQFPYGRVLAMAAALALVVGLGCLTGVLLNRDGKEKTPDIEYVAKEENNGGLTDVEIENEMLAGNEDGYLELDIPMVHWYGEAENAEERLTIFLDRIKGDKLVDLFCAESAGFTETDKMMEDERENFVKNLDAELSQEAMEGTVYYYKAVFQDEIQIEFQISEAGFLQFSELPEVYRLVK